MACRYHFLFATFVILLACIQVITKPLDAAATSSVSSISQYFTVYWSPENARFHGDALQLSLNQANGSAFSSKESYMFGNIDMQMKLVPGNSAGTVTSYYLSSDGPQHDELDFEFLGNSSGQPYMLQTNVFTTGVGGREQRINLWFDPTRNFHTYSVAWSTQRVLFLVDNVPIRVFSNIEKTAGVPYLSRQPLRVFSSIWNGDSWATRGGLVKINWADAPFNATYRNFRANNACIATTTAAASACMRAAAAASNHVGAAGGGGAAFDRAKLAWVQKNFMVYNYCTDTARYNPAPAECSREL